MSGYVQFISPPSLTFATLVEQAFKTRWSKLSHLPVVLIRSHEKRLSDAPDCLGIVLPVSNERVRDMAANLHRPLINVSERLPPCPFAINIHYDSTEIGELAANHLADIGYTRFFFLGDPPAAFSRSRGEAFEKALKRRSLSLQATLSFKRRDRMDPSTTEQREDEEMSEWLPLLGPSAAVFAANDLIAVRFLRALRRCQPDFAETIGLVGVDDDWSRLSDPSEGEPLTSILPNFAGVGTYAADYLERAAHHSEYRPGTVIRIRGARLVERETTGGFSCDDPLLSRIARWLCKEVNCGHSPSVADILERFPMSERTLSEKFRRHRGESMREFIMRKRVQRAARMLLDSDLGIAEIAQHCGFNKHADLSERFTKYMGCSPTRFRRERAPAEDG